MDKTALPTPFDWLVEEASELRDATTADAKMDEFWDVLGCTMLIRNVVFASSREFESSMIRWLEKQRARGRDTSNGDLRRFARAVLYACDARSEANGNRPPLRKCDGGNERR